MPSVIDSMPPYHRHLSDLRIGLLLRGTRVADDAVLRKADTCARVLAEVRRLAAVGSSDELAAAIDRARELLDEVDEALLSLDYMRDHAVAGRHAPASLGHRDARLTPTSPGPPLVIFPDRGRKCA